MPALAATLVTGTVVTATVAWPDGDSASTMSAVSRPAARVASAPSDRAPALSRSAPRVRLTAKPDRPTPTRSAGPAPSSTPSPTPSPTPTPAPTPTRVPRTAVEDHAFMTTDLNLWTGPGESYTLLDVLPTGTKVAVTGEVQDGYAEIRYDGLARWVNASYLSEEDATAEPVTAGGVTDAPCSSGSEVESGLTSNAILVHRSVCATFPQVATYGGIRDDGGEHAAGLALDIMITSSSQGDQIADWVRANASSLGVSQVIWSQHIWTVQRSSEGWRLMEDRGSTTANHYDHVHVTVYG